MNPMICRMTSNTLVSVIMNGRIIKGIAGFYYVKVESGDIYECKAKGIFRKKRLRPLVGDYCEIEVTHEKDMEGNVVKILPRTNSLIRPEVANIDLALVIFSLRAPEPHLYLLDRFLVSMEKQGICSIVCFNKSDCLRDGDKEFFRGIYEKAGYEVLFVSAKTGAGMEEVKERLKKKTTALAGPSGVGKSTTINYLSGKNAMETGEISKKIERGRHTTRHSEIIEIARGTYIMDTPGFTSLYVEGIEAHELSDYFPEMKGLKGSCRFSGCAHIKEPGCAVKEALERGEIAHERYEHYCMMYDEIKSNRKY